MPGFLTDFFHCPDILVFTSYSYLYYHKFILLASFFALFYFICVNLQKKTVFCNLFLCPVVKMLGAGSAGQTIPAKSRTAAYPRLCSPDRPHKLHQKSQSQIACKNPRETVETDSRGFLCFLLFYFPLNQFKSLKERPLRILSSNPHSHLSQTSIPP